MLISEVHLKHCICITALCSHGTILYCNTAKLLNYILKPSLKVNLSVIVCTYEYLITSILLKISIPQGKPSLGKWL